MPGKLAVGSVLARSLRTCLRNAPAFLLLSFIAHAPAILMAWLQASGAWHVRSLPRLRVLLLLIDSVASLIATGFVAYGVFEDLRGRRASLFASLGASVNRMGSIVGAAIRLIFYMAIFFVLCGFALGVVNNTLPAAARGPFSALAVLGALAVFYCRFYVVIPVAVVERAWASRSIERSIALTDGQKWRVAGVVLPLVALDVLVARLDNQYALAYGAITWWVLYTVGTVVLGMLSSTASAVTYHDLRLLKDGVGVDELAQVFE